MQATILSVGKWKEKTLKEAFELYAGRCQPRIELIELELPARDLHGDIKTKEAALLQKHIPTAGTLVACDERGKPFSSRDFAAAIAKWQEAHGPRLTFLIGGADGLAPELVKQAHATLSLSAMTWPHLLARVMLAEQVYRAQTILNNHPYHRD